MQQYHNRSKMSQNMLFVMFTHKMVFICI